MPEDKVRKKVTMYDVAREAGVAQMTVSRVINGGIHVSAGVQKCVRAAIDKLGYEPNEAARMLKGQKAHIIGLIVPTLADSFFSVCANSVQDIATRHGYMTLIQTSSRRAEVETSEIDMMVSRNVAGLLLVPMERKISARLAEVQASGLPIVVLDRLIRGLNASAVFAENTLGAEKAVRHLIGHGHKQIACLGYGADQLSIHERIEGYTNAMKEAGLERQVWRVDSAKAIPALLQRKLKGVRAPSALFTLNNVATIQTLKTLQDLGIRIPKDIALVGFDELELASLLTVPVTAVRQSAHELGRSGANLLFNMMRSETPPKDIPKTHLILPTELVIRNSCGCK